MDVELLYVWIGESENGFIRDQGFHFSPEYRFEMHPGGGGCRLDCTPNENCLNVWKTGNLCGLTAVVGENGTGKTSLINSLMDPDNVDSKLMVYKLDGEFYVQNNLGEEVQYWMPGIRENDLEEINQMPVQMTNARLGTIFDDEEVLGKAALFTPIKEIRQHFATEPWSKGMIPELAELYRYEPIEFDTLAVIHYYYLQIKAQNDPAVNAPEPLLKMKKELRIRAKRSFGTVIGPALGRIRTAPALGTREQMAYDQMFRKSSRLTDQFWLLLLADLYCIADTACDSKLWKQYASEPEAFISELLASGESKSLLNETLLEYYTGAIAEIRALQAILDRRKNVKKGRENNVKLAYDADPEVFADFCGYIVDLLHKKDSFVLNNISFGMQGLSSGETAMLNICSWLKIVHESLLLRPRMKDQNILLLLDELDLYMHPEWQRRFLHFLAQELQAQFREYRIQIVLTTHSPLVLSDVPGGNIIYLGRKTDQCNVVDGPADRETFGANIFTLLKDSFYLERTLGEFAYSRICEVIEDLQKLKSWEAEDPDAYQQHREKCRKHKYLIEVIGEPVVRGKLQRLYTELFPENAAPRFEKHVTDMRVMLEKMPPEERQKHITQLQSELAKLQDQKN